MDKKARAAAIHEPIKTKLCTRCKMMLPYSLFTKCPSVSIGLRADCKNCAAQYRIDYVKKNPEYNRKRYLAAKQRYRDSNARLAKLYPERNKARKKVTNAIRDGRLQRQPCCICGEKGQAHHCDYNKPLNVMWLCRTHHLAWHRVFTADDFIEKLREENKL